MATKSLSLILFVLVIFSTNAVIIGLLARRRPSTRRMLFLGAISAGLSLALVVVVGLVAYQGTRPIDLRDLAAHGLGTFLLVSLSIPVYYFLYVSWFRARKDLEVRERQIALGATDPPETGRDPRPHNSGAVSSPSDRSVPH